MHTKAVIGIPITLASSFKNQNSIYWKELEKIPLFSKKTLDELI